MTKGPTTILTSLASKTADWNSELLLNYTYDTSASTKNYGVLNCTSGSCTINGDTTTPIVTGLKARLITGEEVTNITRMYTIGTTNADSWSLANQSMYYFSGTNRQIGTLGGNNTGHTILSWLIDNTYANTTSGSTANYFKASNEYDTYGYWTLSPSVGDSNSRSSYYVHENGMFGSNAASSNSTDYGARPVITVLKSNLN